MSDWHVQNQSFLSEEMAYLRTSLQGDTALTSGGGDADWDSDFTPALVTLSRSFGLTSFERNLLLLCAAVELEGEFATLCASAHGDSHYNYPTFSLALSRLSEAHWSALTPNSPLRRWRLIELESGRYPLTLTPLRIDERILHYLTGISYITPEIATLMTFVPTASVLVPSHAQQAQDIARNWEQSVGGAPEIPSPLVQLLCTDATLRREMATAVAEAVGLHLYHLDAANLPASEWEPFLRLWEREAVLSNCALYIDITEIESLDAGRRQTLQRWPDHCQGLLILGAERPWNQQRTTHIVEVRHPSRSEQQEVWEQALGARSDWLNGHLERVTSQFDFNVTAIQSAVNIVHSTPLDHNSGRRLWEGCLLQTRPQLEQLAQRLTSQSSWDNLVLPEPQLATLKAMTAQVRQRSVVMQKWGFGARGSRGLGLGALFAGVSGTGKTTAAEVIAAELQLDLFRIDLSSVVSKYIGETEKNLRRIFDAAEAGGSILLFDEADALFGKRSEVKDSHDRHANIEVSYLLQRMESFRGLAILTTNMKQSLDVAFLRRLRFVVNFPFPDVAARIELWRRAFPSSSPTQALEYEKLARLNVAGGNIANIALNAAFLAAEASRPITMQHLLQASRLEYAKLDKSLTIAETGDWLTSVPEEFYDTELANSQG